MKVLAVHGARVTLASNQPVLRLHLSNRSIRSSEDAVGVIALLDPLLGSFYSERSALRDRSLLRPLLTSGRSFPRQISPGKNDYFHRMYSSHLHHTLLVPSGFDLEGSLAQRVVPPCASCSSSRGFASGFLQTPPHDDALAFS